MADDAARRAQNQRPHAKDAVDDLVRLLHFGKETLDIRIQLLIAMIIAVVADGMPLVIDALEDVWMRLGLLSRHIKCRMDAGRLEDVEHGRRILIIRAVIERQIGDLAFAIRSEFRHRRC